MGGPTSLQRRVRGALVAGYIVIVALGFTTAVQPRLFWTILLPLLPISIVLMGFANWRNVCPLAFFGEIGRKANRGTQRRVPQWLERGFFVVTFGGLLVMLVLRLVATNGDGVWLAGLLIALAAVAAVTNMVFTGKTWCNFLCPVGFVERIYTEPQSLPETSNSQCARCTACKSSCPDIDPENAYWQDLSGSGRRLTTYAFPGLVLAFYTYFWLRHGDWEAYFDGRWTRLPVDVDLVLGPGFFFATKVPAVVAAVLTMLVFSALGVAVFAAIESVAGRIVEDGERRRHLILALAAFSAFCLFYLFAGAPSLREVPGGTRAMAFVAPVLATLFLAKRWPRTREQFVREKGAARLLRNWAFEEPPPEDPREVYAWIKAGEHAHDRELTAYANTVRDMIADGLVRRGELRLLDGVRKQLGISEREHEKVLARLSEEERDLFERAEGTGVEERAQLDGYQAALAEALLRRAPEAEIEDLQRAFGVGDEAHGELLERMKGRSGVLLGRARARMERLRTVREDLAILASAGPSVDRSFLAYLLLREQDSAVCGVVQLLEVVGDAERIRNLRAQLFGGDSETRAAAVRGLIEACPEAEDMIRELEPAVVERLRFGVEHDENAFRRLLERLATAADPYIRAGAVWTAGTRRDAWARSLVRAATEDTNALVRETAAGSPTRREPGAAAPFSSLPTVEKMQFLRGVSMFADLDPEDLHELSSFTSEETVEPPDAVCTEGEVDSGDLFVLVDGAASVVLRAGDGEEGEERQVAVVGVGEVIGELSLLDGSPRSATVRPRGGAIRLLRIPGTCFRNRLLPRSRVAGPLMLTLAQRIRELSRRVARD